MMRKRTIMHCKIMWCKCAIYVSPSKLKTSFNLSSLKLSFEVSYFAN